MIDTFRQIAIVRAQSTRSYPDTDRIVVEEPLEVRLEGEPFSVIMRTPGADANLVAGFLLHEGVVRSRDDIRAVEVVDAAIANVRFSRQRAEILPDLFTRRRGGTIGSSCGLCGRTSIESLETTPAPLAADWKVPADFISRLPSALRAAQPTFDETGGLHAAGLFDLDGNLESSAEDVGRHNAVDKVVGAMLMGGRIPLARSLLVVSGRSSFEIAQKAYLGGIPLVAAVSAPSSMAVDFARRAGMTLVGFVRDGRFNIYTGCERVALP